MDDAIVTESDTDNARFGMLDDENHGEGPVFGRRVGSGEDLDRSAARIRLEPVKLVAHRKFARQPAHERMIGIGDGYLEFRIVIVAPRTSTTQDLIELRPVAPIVPQRRMNQ